MIQIRSEEGSAGCFRLLTWFAAFALPLICTAQTDVIPSAAEFAGQDVVPRESAAHDSLRCPLAEGVTTFVVEMPKGPERDRFTFVNENVEARGELKISVANVKLAADDPGWTAVNGTISFSRKRLFNLSMVGVEANYVRLSFRVEKVERIASLGW